MWLPNKSNRPARQWGCRSVVEALQNRVLLSFSAPVTSTGGGDSVAVGDFDGDGRADVVVFVGPASKKSGARVGVSLSNGDGTFRQAGTLSGMAGAPESISTIDRNGDGERDIRAIGFSATTNRKTSTVTRTIHTTTWLGNGDGTFGPASTTSAAWPYGGPYAPSNPWSATADFNHDDLLDVADLRGTSTISVSLGNGDGTYQTGQLFAAGPNAGAIATGDFDGDGWADLVVVNNLSSTQPTFSVLLNDGNW